MMFIIANNVTCLIMSKIKVQRFPFVGLIHTLVVMPRLAPWSSSAAAMSLCPSLAARCKGVYPVLVIASGSAPLANSCWTISCLPRRLEMCRGVCSSWHTTKLCFNLESYMMKVQTQPKSRGKNLPLKLLNTMVSLKSGGVSKSFF